MAVVTRASIGGNNGLTFMIGDGCFFNMSWIEADVTVASDLPFTEPEETSLATNGRMTFMHEFGHALGLGHFQGFNHMRASQPRPLMGGRAGSAHVDAHGDDAQGGRFLYPSGNSEVNLYVEQRMHCYVIELTYQVGALRALAATLQDALQARGRP